MSSFCSYLLVHKGKFLNKPTCLTQASVPWDHFRVDMTYEEETRGNVRHLTFKQWKTRKKKDDKKGKKQGQRRRRRIKPHKCNFISATRKLQMLINIKLYAIERLEKAQD